MGVCCSKNDVVALKNTKGKKTDQTLLLTENVGEVSKLNSKFVIHIYNNIH